MMALDDLLDNLVHHSQGPSTNPWPRCTFDEDFILISEFSELEGPRTVMTIPASGGGSFNKNSFAVRIMSVDCTSWQTTGESRDGLEAGFNISGDTQVVMTEPNEGAAAYVHYFTLYDIHARGFVRPFCIAYITSQYSKIMNNYNSLFRTFTKVASSFKFGNAMSFLQDLKLRYGFLENLKKMKFKMENGTLTSHAFLEKHAKEIENIGVDDCIIDTLRLRTIFWTFLYSSIFEEQQERYCDYVKTFVEENDDFLSIEESSKISQNESISREHLTHLRDVETVEAELASETDSDSEFSNLSPHSVGITGGRRFDIYLRTIEELCKPVGKDALFLTENIYFVLKSCTGELNTEEERMLDGTEKDADDEVLVAYKVNDQSNAPKPEQDEPDGVNTTVTKCYRRSLSFPREPVKDSFRSKRSHSASMQQWDPMFNLFDDEWSLKSSDSYEIIKHSHSSDEEVTSTSSGNTRNSSPKIALPGKVEKLVPLDFDAKEAYPLWSLVAMPSGKPMEAIATPKNKLYEGMNVEPIIIRSAPLDRCVSTGSRSSYENLTFVERTTLGSYNPTRRCESDSTLSEPQTEERLTRYSTHQISTETLSSTDSGQPIRKYAFRKFTSVLGPDSGYYFPDTSNFSLYKIRQIYHFLPHLIFSLLIGRPVVIHAERTNEGKVRCLVKSLFPFIPGLHDRHNGVIFWTKGPLHISLLHSMKLVGLTKTRRIQRSIKPYISVLDFEACRLIAPPYEGVYLNNIFDPSKEWPSEDTFMEYLKGVQRELTAYCFVNFSLMFLDEDQYISFDKTNLILDEGYLPSSWARSLHKNHEEFFEGKLLPGDKLIIQHLTDVVKEQLVRNLTENDKQEPGTCIYSEQYQLTGSRPAAPRIRLSKLRCQEFPLVRKKEK